MDVIAAMRTKQKGDVKASLTVEASFLIPIILFTIVGGIKVGYSMLKETKNMIQIEEELTKLDPVELVRTKTLIQGLKDR